MKLTLLGTGTSQGVPVIGCRCEVCTSTDPRDKRLRSSALLSDQHSNILIDCGPDLRQQMLRNHTEHLEAILLTHEHNDHVIGLDDVRPFNFASGKPLDVYGLPRVLGELKKRFDYVFGEPIPGLPRIELRPIQRNESFEIQGVQVQSIGVEHGNLPILGFRFSDIAYLTDVKSLKPDSLERLAGVRHLVINALHHRPHPAHLNLQEALALIEKIAPHHAWLTHLSHHFGLFKDYETRLPQNVGLAYDGLQIDSILG